MALLIPAGVAMASSVATNLALYTQAPGSTFTVDVVITGGGQLQGANIGIIIGDGGASAGGSDTSPPAPIFTAATMNAGTIWAGNTTGDNFTIAPPDLAVFMGTTTNTGSVNGNGPDAVLARLTVNVPVGAPEGDWLLTFFSDDTTVVGGINGGASLVDSWTGGTIHVTPEPATALLLIGALPFLRRRRTA